MSAEASAKIESFVASLVEAGADAPFLREGLIFWLVPLWIVEAYARARFERRDVLNALVVEAVGEAAAAECRQHPQVLIWTLARAWMGRLGELERKARGITEKAA